MNSENQGTREGVENDCAEKSRDANGPARPAFHFTPPTGWMNDPNGLVFYDGEYHLFYQHNPHGDIFGPMHWGHAVSRDLVNWTQLPTALHPDEHGQIYSGSVVVDWKNSSGLGTADGLPPLVAIYTYHHADREKGGRGDHQTQALAFSNDRGRTWTKFEGNPVLGNEKNQADFRDPKVFWHKATSKWIKALAVGDHVGFFASMDLKEWAFLSAFGEGLHTAGNVWECPDLFPLTAPDGGEKWVLIVSVNPGGPQGGSGTQYFIGDFDGTEFTLDTEFSKLLERFGTMWLDWGGDNYAGVTWSDIPEADGRRLFIGWMSNWLYAQTKPSSGWRGAMTTPRELSLARAGGAVLLAAKPVQELARQMPPRKSIIANKSDYSASSAISFEPGEFTIAGRLHPHSSAVISIELRNRSGEWTKIGFNAGGRNFYCKHHVPGENELAKFKSSERRPMPRYADSSEFDLRFLIDRNSVELFADGGVSVFTETFFPVADYEEIRFLAENTSSDEVEIWFSRFANMA